MLLGFYFSSLQWSFAYLHKKFSWLSRIWNKSRVCLVWKTHVCMLSHIWLFVIPWAVSCQAPLSMRLCRTEYWNGLPCPPSGDLSYTGIEPMSPMVPALTGRFFTTEPPITHKISLDVLSARLYFVLLPFVWCTMWINTVKLLCTKQNP